MGKAQTLRQIGASVGTVLPKSMLERFNLGPGDTVYVVETEHGLLITPYDPDFADALDAYRQGARKYRNALRALAK